MNLERSLETNRFENFLYKLIYLGGNLGIKPKMKKYVDLEEFIAEATLFMENDSRTTQCILNWIYLFAPYFSPSKLRRVLKIKKYSPKYLYQFIELIKSHPLNSQNWDILDSYKSRTKKFKFTPNFEKYLKTKSYIIKNCPEIKYRIQGNNQVLADLKAYLDKNKSFQSLYRIAKDTFNPRNRINYEYELIQYIA